MNFFQGRSLRLCHCNRRGIIRFRSASWTHSQLTSVKRLCSTLEESWVISPAKKKKGDVAAPFTPRHVSQNTRSISSPPRSVKLSRHDVKDPFTSPLSTREFTLTSTRRPNHESRWSLSWCIRQDPHFFPFSFQEYPLSWHSFESKLCCRKCIQESDDERKHL
jgi:hypothetical protein